MKKIVFRFLCFISLLHSAPTFAGFGPSILDPTLLSNQLPDDVATEAAKTFGVYFAHRPYQGATSIQDENSTEFKFETTLVKIGDGLFESLEKYGASGSIQDTPALPTLKLHIRKPISKGFDIGASGLFVAGQYVAGADLKFVLFQPEEGLTASFRLGATYATAKKFNLERISVISPEFVVSRKFDFVEPYLGIGGRYIWGKVSVTFDLPPAPSLTISKTGSGSTAYAFTGVSFILGSKGLRLAMEGTYDISGFSSIGSMIGFGI
jgi:hypothetical protein